MIVRRLLRIALAVAAIAVLPLLAVPAHADGSAREGTPAWALVDLALREGPGGAYAVIGSIPENSRIAALRCAPRWCLVRMGHSLGWTSRDAVGFGRLPLGPFEGPRLNYGTGGTVCFYEGAHFTGPSVCHNSGFIVHDLKLYGTDNRYMSVSIDGSASVSVCRDRNFQSYCTRVVTSTPVLDTYLAGSVSSYWIH